LRQGDAAEARSAWWTLAVGCGLVVSLLALGAAPASAERRDADPLSLGPIEPRPGAGPVRDRVLEGKPRGAARASAASGPQAYQDQDGHTVTVRVSEAYANPGAVAQNLVDFLGTLLHGDEMNDLTVFIATPAEIRGQCGAGVLACYFPDAEEMVVSGDDAGPKEPPREFVIAHEYGHHVATNRRNKPWSALQRGTKRWSTYEGICRGIKRGRIHPGNYFQNPGEAHAEAFAFYHFRDAIPWEWRIARPDQGSFDAIFADVMSPWTRRTSIGFSGELAGRGAREVHRIRLPLDGRLRVKLDGPPGADFDLRLLAPRRPRVLDRALSPAPDETLFYTVCGRRGARIAVRSAHGSGRFDLTASRP
jgi:hypothetical protein